MSAGCLHPDHQGYFNTPAEYTKWYASHGPLRANANAPTVALLLYRKHVITGQSYIATLISTLEAEGIRPVPIFINGVEAHTVVGSSVHFNVYSSLCYKIHVAIA